MLTANTFRHKKNINNKNTRVVVHPLVLLSVVDHFHRMDGERVIGLLLGYVEEKNESLQKSSDSSDTKEEFLIIHVTNSFALPFDNHPAWHIDTQYITEALRLNNKVSKKENVLGWYHTGPDLFSNDIEITKFFQNYNQNCLMAVVDVKCKGMPVSVYQLKNNSFENLKSVIEAEEAEEVGVEHLLREIRDVNMENGYNKMSSVTEKKVKSVEESEMKETDDISNNESFKKENSTPFLTMTGHDVLSGLKVYKEKLETVLSEIDLLIEKNEPPKEEFLQLLLKCLRNVQSVEIETDTVSSKLSIDSTKKDTISTRPCSDGAELVGAVAKSFILGGDLMNNRREF